MTRARAYDLKSSGNQLADTARGDFSDPMRAAEAIVRKSITPDGHRCIHYWQAEFFLWDSSQARYAPYPLPDVREMLYRVGAHVSGKPIRKRHVDDVLDALRAITNLSHRLVPSAPAWFPSARSDPDPRAVIPVRNGILRIDNEELLPASARYFATLCLPIVYQKGGPSPEAWLQFCASLWPDDQASIDCLQEWLGYSLSVDTSLQKALMIVGPPRSGKGTVARMIVRLLGEANVAAPTLAAFGMQFGLEALLRKMAALVSDARLGARADIAAIAENLLRLTGEDNISVHRKFQTAYTTRLPTRIVVLTNEIPTFRDAAAALPGRFVILRTTESFSGREDHALEAKLAGDLPGILAWALAGLRRLRGRGRFIQPASAQAEMRLMKDPASPIHEFLRERCVVDRNGQVPTDKLYAAWRTWCEDRGRDRPGPDAKFGRDLSAAVPGLQRIRPRGPNGARFRAYAGVRMREPDDPPVEDCHADDTDELFKWSGRPAS